MAPRRAGRLTLVATGLLLAAFAVGAELPAATGSGLDLAGFDRSVRPQDDLYGHVNGGWLATTEVPSDRARWGALDRLRDEADARVRAIFDSPAPVGRPEATAIRAYYASYMDEALTAQLGAAPLAAELQRIAALADRIDVARYLGATVHNGVSTPIDVVITIDWQEPTTYMPFLWQGGLGMPDRDYYLREDGEFAALRAGYAAYLERLFTLAGLSDPPQRAAQVMALEHALAQAQWSQSALRDPRATYNRYDPAGASVLAPGFAVVALLDGAGLPSDSTFVVGQPDYLTALGQLLETQPPDVWRSYLQARLLDSFAPFLSPAFVAAEFDFHSRQLRGVPELRPRWKQAVAEVNRGMGFAVGREYVERHFPVTAQARMDRLVGHLIAAMRAGIDELEWMSPPTRVAAQDKLARLSVKVGYPARWRSYTGLEIRADDLVGNVLRATAFEWRRVRDRLGSPVDRDDWQMTPQTVNAYYAWAANEIAFPAAILQPPFFQLAADDAVNYGAIGAIIGHEISHGFDDQGRRYDGEGRLRDWWTEADDVAFRTRTERLVAQYDGYRPLPDAAIDGRLSLGENIADLSGLAIAWRAFQLAREGRKPQPLDGFNEAQRFFLGYAQAWRVRYRESALREQLVKGPHAPGEFRANGAVSNFEPFYEAFGLREGDALWRPPAGRVRIW